MVSHKRAVGEPLGRVPFGWRRNGKGYEPDPDQQAILQEAARRYVAGETMQAIAADLGLQQGPLARMLRSDRVQEALPDDLSERLATALAERRFQRVPTSRQTLLGGLAVCGICRETLKASSTRAGRKNGRWYAYACRTPGHVHIAARMLDVYVTDKVIGAADSGRLVEAVRRLSPVRSPRRVAVLEARLAALEEDHYVNAKISRARFEELRDQLIDRIDTAKRSERRDGVDLPADLARHLGERWGDLTITEQRQVIAAVYENVIVNALNPGKRGRIDARRVRLVRRR
jgi:hypothetical protein